MCSMLPNIRDNVWHILLPCLEQNTESEWLSSYQTLGVIIPLQCFTNADWLKNPNIFNVGLCSAVSDQHSSGD